MIQFCVSSHNESTQALRARDAVLDAVAAEPGISLSAVLEQLVNGGYRYCEAQSATWELLNDRRGITGHGTMLYPVAA
jgi:hypothetical protein